MRRPRTFGWLVAALVMGCGAFREEVAPDGGADGGGASADAAGDAVATGDGATNDGGACGDTCSTDKACKSWDFTGTTCPTGVAIATDGTPPIVVVTCNGSLHIFATNTLDVDVTLSVQAPASVSSVHAAAKATIREWQGISGKQRRVMRISTDGSDIAELQATTASGNVVYSLCKAGGSTCQPATGMVVETTPHRLTLDVTKSGKVTFSVDCAEVATLESGTTPLPNKEIDLIFGDTDGQNLDGDFGDVIVDFNRP